MNALHVLPLQGARRIDYGVDACKNTLPFRSIGRQCHIERDVMRIRRGCRMTRHQYAFMPFGGETCANRRADKASAANQKDTHLLLFPSEFTVSQAADQFLEIRQNFE